MKTIVHRSTAVVTFLGLVGLALTLPQMRHLERFTDLLVVAPRRKILAQLALQERDGVDPSNLADFFRISPWEPDEVRLPLLRFIFAYLKKHRQLHGLPLYFTLDDSLTAKDKGTHKLQGIDWHFDHNHKRIIKGGCHVVLGIHWGDFHSGIWLSHETPPKKHGHYFIYDNGVIYCSTRSEPYRLGLEEVHKRLEAKTLEGAFRCLKILGVKDSAPQTPRSLAPLGPTPEGGKEDSVSSNATASSGVQPADGRSGRTSAAPYPPDGEAEDTKKGPHRPAADHPWRRGFRGKRKD